MAKITLTKAYLGWLIISIISWIVAWKTGSLFDLLGQSVDLSGALTENISRDEMIIVFVVISLIYWLVSVFIIGLFLLLTNKQKIWARYIFIILCIYQLCYEIYAHSSILNTYTYSYKVHDYIFAILSIAFVAAMLLISIFTSKFKNTANKVMVSD